MHAVGRRVGILRLSEVMRQRDPAERRALAALHDGQPQAWLNWAREHDRVSAGAAGELADQAVAQWHAAALEHGLRAAVLIARDNDMRHALNDRARALLAHHGALGEAHASGR